MRHQPQPQQPRTLTGAAREAKLAELLEALQTAPTIAAAAAQVGLTYNVARHLLAQHRRADPDAPPARRYTRLAGQTRDRVRARVVELRVGGAGRAQIKAALAEEGVTISTGQVWRLLREDATTDGGAS